MGKRIPTNVNTENHPAWLGTIIPNEYVDDDLFRIIMFFVFHAPSKEQSARGVTLQERGWKEKPWYSPSYLKERLDEAIFGNNQKIFISSTSANFSTAIKNNDFGDDFYNHRNNQRIAIVNSCDNEYLSFFYHIRNALAHGRIAMYQATNNDIMFVMEDGKSFNEFFEVKARMLVLKSSLLNIIRLIENPPEDVSYDEDILNLISSGTNTKKAIIDNLKIDETIWNSTICRLKIENRIHFENSKWAIV